MEMPGGRGEKRFGEKMRLHLANERTFLSWIRTSISLMALGFVVAKFDLLPPGGAGQSSVYYSALFGVLFITLGVFINVGAVVRFLYFKKQIERGSGGFSLLGDYILSASILIVVFFLLFYFLRHIL